VRLRPHELQKHLQGPLAPIYVVSGDEPLQLGEVSDAIRAAARQQGYSERDIIEANAKFAWSELTAEANNLSLFAEKRVIDLRITNGKPGKEGSKVLVEYAGRIPEDTLLLITLPKLERAQLTSKWVKALENRGALIQIWPVEGERLLPWIEQRMRQAGLTPGPDVVPILAEHIEGNLLAASQEIQKLQLLHGSNPISAEELNQAVSDSARYDVFSLVDSALAGDTVRCTRILHGLKAEGTATPVVLWALTREIRLLHSLAVEVTRGKNRQQAIAANRGVWDKRKALVNKGLQRLNLRQWRQLLSQCGKTDLAIKGQSPDNPWLLLEQITIRMSNTRTSRP